MKTIELSFDKKELKILKRIFTKYLKKTKNERFKDAYCLLRKIANKAVYTFEEIDFLKDLIKTEAIKNGVDIAFNILEIATLLGSIEMQKFNQESKV